MPAVEALSQACETLPKQVNVGRGDTGSVAQLFQSGIHLGNLNL